MMDLRLDEIIEAATRRERALAAGSTHVPADARSDRGPRPDAVSSLDAPEILWPLQKDQLPPRCENCGAGRASFEITPPYGSVRYGDATCLMCTRVVRRLKSDALRRMSMTDGDLNPKRGRPPGKAAQA